MGSKLAKKVSAALPKLHLYFAQQKTSDTA